MIQRSHGNTKRTIRVYKSSLTCNRLFISQLSKEEKPAMNAAAVAVPRHIKIRISWLGLIEWPDDEEEEVEYYTEMHR